MLHRILIIRLHTDFKLKKKASTRIGLVLESISGETRTDMSIANSFMQLPGSLDSGFFLWEYVFSTVLNDGLIVSATMH